MTYRAFFRRCVAIGAAAALIATAPGPWCARAVAQAATEIPVIPAALGGPTAIPVARGALNIILPLAHDGFAPTSFPSPGIAGSGFIPSPYPAPIGQSPSYVFRRAAIGPAPQTPSSPVAVTNVEFQAPRSALRRTAAGFADIGAISAPDARKTAVGAVSARERLEEGSSLIRNSQEPRIRGDASGWSLWSAFWHGDAARRASDGAVASLTTASQPSKPSLLEKTAAFAGAASVLAPATALVPAAVLAAPTSAATPPASALVAAPSSIPPLAPIPASPITAIAVSGAHNALHLPAWIGANLHKALPFVVVGATWLVDRAARRALSVLAKRRNWSDQQLFKRKLISDIAIWGLGLTFGLHFVGTSLPTFLATLGAGSVGLSFAIKEPLGNMIKGGLLIFSHPFDIGDRITIPSPYKDEGYVVQDMRLQYIVLQEVKDPNSHTTADYSLVADLPITVYREYDTSKRWIPLARQNINLSSPKTLTPLKKLPKPRTWLRGLLLGAGIAASAGAIAAGTHVFGVLASGIPYLIAEGTAVGTWLLAKLVSRLMYRLATRRRWEPHVGLILRSGATFLTYLIGFSASLRIAGTSWVSFLAGLGITGVVVSVAVSDIVSNWLYGRIQENNPDRRFRVGDHVKILDYEGTLHAFASRYLIIKAEGKETKFFWIPYSFLKNTFPKNFNKYIRVQDPPSR